AFEPDAKRRAYDNGFNVPTTFTSALSTPSSHSDGNTAATAAAAAAAAAAAINEFNGNAVATSVAAAANTITRSMYSDRYLLEENQTLRRQLDELKQQTADLMAANEYLMEQNAQLRSLNGMPA